MCDFVITSICFMAYGRFEKPSGTPAPTGNHANIIFFNRPKIFLDIYARWLFLFFRFNEGQADLELEATSGFGLSKVIIAHVGINHTFPLHLF